jgi:hypothetical protein
MAAVSGANAGTFFEPLTAPNTDNTQEDTAPFTIPANHTQTFVASWNTMDAYFGGTYPATFRNWDMIDFGGDNAEFIYIPHEVGPGGAGVTRYNRDTGEAVILLQGDNDENFDLDPTDGWTHLGDDFGGLDPAVVTPTGSLLTAEEWAGGGRIFELSNPTTATSPADADWQWLSNIPSVSHEGVKFDAAGNLYFVDENSSGSIYKFVPSVAGDLSHGQVFVLKVDANAADGAVGAASWVAMTDENNVALTSSADPFDFTSRGGRAAADELGANGYCRPEDATMGTLASGNEVLYFAATCSNIVYSVEFTSDMTAMVREFVNSNVTPDTIGNSPVGTGNPSDSTYGLDDPDNLASDAAGNVYIIEDENPSDVWQAVDADKDGVAESVALFASLGKYGSEGTGFKNDPRDPFTWYIAIQHPASGNDALWTISHDVSQYCGCQTAKNHGKYVSCIAHTAKDLGIRGEEKDALMDIAANSSCGK